MAKKTETVKINLLPAEVQPYRPLFKERKRVLMALGAAAVFLLYGFLLGHTWFILRHLEAVRTQMSLYQPQEEEARKVRQEIDNLRRQKAELEKLVQSRQKWSDFLLALAAALPREVWLTKLEVTPNQEILLTGRAYNLAAVGDSLRALQSMSFLQSVKLQSVQAATEEDRSVLEFTLKALIKQP